MQNILSFIMASCFLLLVVFTTTCSIANVWVVESLCVANLSLPANNDGIYPCKDPKFVTVNDFFFSRLYLPPVTTKERNAGVTQAYDLQLPGLNTLGMSAELSDVGPGFYMPPHYHPGITKLIVPVRGAILIQFNTSAPESRSFTKVVREGEVIVIPKDLHIQYKNYGETDAALFTAFSSQRPKLIWVN